MTCAETESAIAIAIAAPQAHRVTARFIVSALVTFSASGTRARSVRRVDSRPNSTFEGIQCIRSAREGHFLLLTAQCRSSSLVDAIGIAECPSNVDHADEGTPHAEGPNTLGINCFGEVAEWLKATVC